jgi:hypothetical protein
MAKSFVTAIRFMHIFGGKDEHMRLVKDTLVMRTRTFAVNNLVLDRAPIAPPLAAPHVNKGLRSVGALTVSSSLASGSFQSGL